MLLILFFCLGKSSKKDMKKRNSLKGVFSRGSKTDDEASYNHHEDISSPPNNLILDSDTNSSNYFIYIKTIRSCLLAIPNTVSPNDIYIYIYL